MLVVDDDVEMAHAMALELESAGRRCTIVESGEAALEACRGGRFDLVVTDVRMERMDGFQLLERLKESQPGVPVILVTGAASVPAAVMAVKRGAHEYITKPCDAEQLRRAVDEALEQAARTKRVGATTHDETPRSRRGEPEAELIGTGAAMTVLREQIDLVAAASSPVLITGETGTGKELVARAIHAKSARRSRTFVTVNASAIPEPLLESELFGHVRGAFTGATQSHRGLFLEAEGGTLLLDEIGDMPLALQPKLLRVLQAGEIRAVGGSRVERVDVRIIAATHRDLASLVRAGSFREDLYYRLHVVPVVVPPLRERREDIPELARALLARAKVRAPRSPVESFDDALLDLLATNEWPGNVRELESVIERLAVLADEPVLRPKHLAMLGEPASSPNSVPPGDHPGLCSLDHLVRRHVDAVLAHTGGNKPKAVEILGIDLSTLYRWQKKWLV